MTDAKPGNPLIGVAIACIAVIALIYADGASLLRDYLLRNQQFVPAQASISEAKCKTYWVVYTRCNVGYRPFAPQQPASTIQGQPEWLSYSFLGPVAENTVRLMRPASSPATVVADIGINRIGNRLLLFVVALVAFGSLGFFSVRKMMAEA